MSNELPNIKLYVTLGRVNDERSAVVAKPPDWSEMTELERERWCDEEYRAFAENTVEGGWYDTDEEADW